MQRIHLEFDFDGGVGVPGAFNHRAPTGEPAKVIHHVNAHTTSEAIRVGLEEMAQKGIHLDGEVKVTALKEQQIGGDDGVMLLAEGPGITGTPLMPGVVLKVTAPEEERE